RTPGLTSVSPYRGESSVRRHARPILGAPLSTRPWNGPEWDDPALTRLATQLRDAHRAVAPLPKETRQRLIRHLLAITDLAKRDPELAARRLETFLTEFEGADFRPSSEGR